MCIYPHCLYIYIELRTTQTNASHSTLDEDCQRHNHHNIIQTQYLQHQFTSDELKKHSASQILTIHQRIQTTENSIKFLIPMPALCKRMDSGKEIDTLCNDIFP